METLSPLTLTSVPTFSPESDTFGLEDLVAPLNASGDQGLWFLSQLPLINSLPSWYLHFYCLSSGPGSSFPNSFPHVYMMCMCSCVCVQAYASMWMLRLKVAVSQYSLVTPHLIHRGTASQLSPELTSVAILVNQLAPGIPQTLPSIMWGLGLLTLILILAWQVLEPLIRLSILALPNSSATPSVVRGCC